MIVVCVCGVYMLTPLHRMTPSIMAGSISGEFNLTASSLGLLSSITFFSFGLMQMVDGVLIDYYGPRKMLPCFVAFVAAGTLCFAYAPSFGGLLAGRVLIGLGTSILCVAGLKLFASWFPPSTRVRLNGLLLGMGGLGLILGSGLMGYLCDAFGWRDANGIIGVVTVVLVVLILCVVRDAPGDAPQSAASPPVSPLAAMRTVCCNREFAIIAGWFCCQFCLHNAFGGLWSGEYLRQVHHLDTVTIGNILNMLGVGTLVGSVANAWICDRFYRGVRPIMLVSPLVHLGLFVSLMLWGDSFGIPALCIWFFLLAAFGMGVMFAGFSVMPDLFASSIIGTASGLLNTLPSLAVLALQPVTGLVLEWVGGVKPTYTAAEFSIAFSVYVGGSLLSTVFGYKAYRLGKGPDGGGNPPALGHISPVRQ